jgi:serine/threonine-protein kinase
MNPHWERVKEIFGAAIQRPAEERSAFVVAEAGEDQELREDVESLLASDALEMSDPDRLAHAQIPIVAALLGNDPVEDTPRHSAYSAGDRIGAYEVVGLLGAGAMGEVYRAHDTTLNRDVALKVLPAQLGDDRECLARFTREARLLAACTHRNIAAIYGLEESASIRALVLELIDGPTLAEHIVSRAAATGGAGLPMNEALAIARQLADALEAAHEKGVIHRDIKPANIKLAPDGTVKVLDFGLARMWDGAPHTDRSSSPRLTVGGVGEPTILGTPAYMSPEQARGQLLDRRTDIWSFACVLYEMLTGVSPFARETISDSLAAALEHEPDYTKLPGDTPEPIRRLLPWCLEKDAKRRLDSAAAIRLEIDDALASGARGRVALRWYDRRAAWAAAGCGAIVALLVSLVVSGVLRLPASSARPIGSLAVLAFDNLSRDPEQDYFAEGITDGLITDLAKLDALRVISRTSVMQYKGSTKSIPDIARELHVDAVLEGAVTRVEDRVRITAQLIAASPEKLLWTGKYEAALSDIVNLQDTVTMDVAREVQITLTPREQQLLGARRTVVPAAYEAYLRGRYLWERPTEENLKRSREFFQEATGRDPGYALAWAGLALAENELANWGVIPSQDARPRARAAAQKALELDDTLVEPLVTLADVKMNYEWDPAGAERLCRRAIALNPNAGYAHHVYATHLAARGRLGTRCSRRAGLTRRSRYRSSTQPTSPGSSISLATTAKRNWRCGEWQLQIPATLAATFRRRFT